MRAVILPALLVVAAALAMMLGDLPMGPLMLWKGMTAQDPIAQLVVNVIRGPRVVTALGAGAALGLSGALFQTLFRNPLASPDIMGFTSGAGLTVLSVIALGLLVPIPVAAAAGGLGTALIVAAVSWRPGHATPPLVLVLVGLGLGFACSALSSFVMTALPPNAAADAQRWLAGSLNARNWTHAGQVWLALIVLAAAMLTQRRPLEALELGRPLSIGLGIRAERSRWLISGLAVLMAAVAVAVAGPVPFVALMAAPLGARIAGARNLSVRLFSGMMAGALIMVLADLAARALVAGIALPVGIATGIMGAPYLLWRLMKEMKKGGL